MPDQQEKSRHNASVQDSLFLSNCPSPWAAAVRPDLLQRSCLKQFSPSIITCIKHTPSPLTYHPLPPRHILDPFPHIFKALPSWTPWSDSQQGPLQPIREVIHTLPHLSYLLYYHPGWPIPRRYPLRPRAQAGYPGFQQDWQCHPKTPHPPPSAL